MGLKSFLTDVITTARHRVEERAANAYSMLAGVMGRFFFSNGEDCPSIGDSTAMRITTFFTCVLVRAEGLATMPCSVMQKTEEGSRVAREDPAHYLIHNRPNPFQTAHDFWKTVSAHIDVYGNCFAIVRYSGNLRPRRIDLVKEPNGVQILETDGGEVYYEYNGKTYRDYEVLHFKDLSLDGIYGCSRVKYNAHTLGYTEKLQKFGINSIGLKPNGYFTTQASFETIKKQQETLSNTWTKGIADGKVPFLPNGLEYKSLMISPEDAQFLETIDAKQRDICGFMRVPPTMVQNYTRAVWANAEQQDLTYVKYTMLPIATNIEQELNSKLFAEANKTAANYKYCKFNANAFMRGDFKTRTEGYKTLWERGLITGNQVADLEDWNHFEGGDDRWVPMNMIKVSQQQAFIDNMTEPIPTNAGDEGGDNKRSKPPVIDGFKINGKDLILNGHEK